MHISYKSILHSAWQITFKNKVLWLFGIFASFIALEGVYEIVLSQLKLFKKLNVFHLELITLYEKQISFINYHTYFWKSFSQDIFSYFVIVLILTIFILFIWLVFISQIYIIKAAEALYKKKKIQSNQILEQSMPKFWSVLGLNIVVKIILYAGFIGLSLPLLYALLNQSESQILSANLFFFIVFTIFAIILSFIAAYATNFIVLKGLHIFEAIHEAWSLFRRNIILSLEVAFVLFILKLLSIIIIFCILAVVFVPLFVIFVIALQTQNAVAFILVITLVILFFTIISALINAIYSVFYLASWTITFLSITQETLFAKAVKYIKLVQDFVNTPQAKEKQAKFKKQAKVLAKKTEKEAKILGKLLENQYTIYEPKVKKEGKVLLKKLETNYKRLEPKIKKEIKKEIKKIKNQTKKTKKKPTKRKATPKRSSKTKKTVKKTSPSKRTVKTKRKTTRKK